MRIVIGLHSQQHLKRAIQQYHRLLGLLAIALKFTISTTLGLRKFLILILIQNIEQSRERVFGQLLVKLNIQWVLFNAYNQPKPWTVRYPIEFANKTIAVSATRYNGEYSFSEIILSTSRNQLTYKDSDYRGQQGVGDQIMFIILGNQIFPNANQ